MYKEYADSHLWASIRLGDKAALGELFERYYFLLVKTGIVLCENPELAKDTANDIFFDFWINRGTLSDVAQVKAYVQAVYRNRLFTVLKKQNREKDAWVAWSETEDTYEVSYEDLLVTLQLKSEQKEELRKALEMLTPRQKEYLRLKFFEGMSYDAIAAHMGQAVKTVYNTTYEALKILRQKISL